MASTVWKGYISFGLISIPIKLYAAARDERVGFHQIHAVCNTRVKQQLFCPTCDRVVERSELARGYEAEKDHYVLVNDEELKKITPTSSETMEILGFVELKEIDPLYFDASYYAVADAPGQKAYALLLTSLEELKYAALAKVTMHQREHLAVIRPYHHGLTLHTMFYANEVRELAEYGKDAESTLKPQEVALAEQLIKNLAVPFEPDKYRDTYQEAVVKMIADKEAHRSVHAQPTRRLAPVIDLADALQKSLASLPEAGTKAKPAVKQMKALEAAASASSSSSSSESAADKHKKVVKHRRAS